MSAIWAMQGAGPVPAEAIGPTAQVVNRADGATLVVGELQDVMGALLADGFVLESLRRAMSD